MTNDIPMNVNMLVNLIGQRCKVENTTPRTNIDYEDDSVSFSLTGKETTTDQMVHAIQILIGALFDLTGNTSERGWTAEYDGARQVTLRAPSMQALRELMPGFVHQQENSQAAGGKSL